MDYNRVFISGIVTREPEKFSTVKDKLILKLNIQVKDRKRSNFFNVILFNHLAEEFEKRIEKGDRIFIEGKLRYTKYTTRTGALKNKVEIIAENLHIIEKGGIINGE